MSGLQINYKKRSIVQFNMSELESQKAETILGCDRFKHPTRHVPWNALTGEETGKKSFHSLD